MCQETIIDLLRYGKIGRTYWCPYYGACKISMLHPKCVHPYYKICFIYQMKSNR